MNLRRFAHSLRRHPLAGVALGICLVLSACHKAVVTADAPVSEASNDSEGVTLKPEEIAKMGIVTTAAASVMHAPEASGFAVVLAHETIATAVAELRTAAATERQSRAALERTQRLAGTAGAMPVDTVEGLQRQAEVDRVALELAQRRLSALFGQHPPWKDQVDAPQLRALAAGEAKMARVSFPLGSTGDAPASVLRLAHINASQAGKSIETHVVWSAPADASLPGRSYFAYLKTSDFGEGERLLAWVPIGQPESGVLVPAAAAIINAGKFWCYVEEKPGRFVRSELDPNMATAEGYFVNEGIEPGAKIVTVSAGQLLARELNPSSAAD
jgi:hypothetical protein